MSGSHDAPSAHSASSGPTSRNPDQKEHRHEYQPDLRAVRHRILTEMRGRDPEPPIGAAAWDAMNAQAAAQRLCDTSDMVIVHRMFRRECALLAKLVAAVAGDVARARSVAEHAREVLDMLHHHHVGEDELLWPRLSARTRFHADLLARMDSQHQGLAVLLEHAATAFAEWRDYLGTRNFTLLHQILDQLREITDPYAQIT